PNAAPINGTAYFDNIIFTEPEPEPGPSGGGAVEWDPDFSSFPNPERGFYRVSAGNGSLAHTGANYSTYRANNVSLNYSRIDLANFRTSAISQAYLDDLADGFDHLRAARIKGVVRIVYNNGYAPDASMEIVELH